MDYKIHSLRTCSTLTYRPSQQGMAWIEQKVKMKTSYINKSGCKNQFINKTDWNIEYLDKNIYTYTYINMCIHIGIWDTCHSLQEGDPFRWGQNVRIIDTIRTIQFEFIWEFLNSIPWWRGWCGWLELFLPIDGHAWIKFKKINYYLPKQMKAYEEQKSKKTFTVEI